MTSSAGARIVGLWLILSDQVNFARAVQDPYDPTFLNPVDNSGDSLHPGDLGYENMAAVVPLAFVTAP